MSLPKLDLSKVNVSRTEEVTDKVKLSFSEGTLKTENASKAIHKALRGLNGNEAVSVLASMISGYNEVLEMPKIQAITFTDDDKSLGYKMTSEFVTIKLPDPIKKEENVSKK